MELNAVDGAFCPSVNVGFLRENSASPHSSSSSSLNASSSDRRRLTFTMRWCRGVCLETESIVPSRSSFWSEKDKRFPPFFFEFFCALVFRFFFFCFFVGKNFCRFRPKRSRSLFFSFNYFKRPFLVINLAHARAAGNALPLRATHAERSERVGDGFSVAEKERKVKRTFEKGHGFRRAFRAASSD